MSYLCCRMGPTVRALGSILPQLGGSTVLFHSSFGKKAEMLSRGCSLRPHRALGLRFSSLRVDFWLQVAIFLFAAGFVDAGFSGDWSRIGVLTKETEWELQMAAIGVVPLAATLIWSVGQRRKIK